MVVAADYHQGQRSSLSVSSLSVYALVAKRHISHDIADSNRQNMLASPMKPLVICKANKAMMLAKQKAVRALKKAEAASVAAKIAQQQVLEEIEAHAPQRVAAPARTSTKAFAAKDPHQALAALECIDLNSTTKHEFSQLQIVASKYAVRTLSEALAKTTDGSVRASAMMATRTVRFVFDVACELAAEETERSAVLNSLVWQSPQAVLKGRETRGAGVVAYSESALELLNTALTAAKARVKERVAASDKYASAMQATVAASEI